jgi:hypothetical protein
MAMVRTFAAHRTSVVASAHATVALLCLAALWSLPALAQTPLHAGAKAVDRGPDPELDDARTAAPPPVAAAAARSTVRVSGTIRSLQTGAGIYGKLVPWNEATGAVAGLIYASTDGVWSADLEPGTYAFYVRSFGHLPILLEHIAVAGPMTLDPVIDTLASRATPAYLTGSALADPIVLADGLDATTFTLTSTKDLGPSVDLLNEFGHLAADGEARGTVPLHDDGTHGDAVAGDRVYTSDAVGFAGATPNWGGRTSYDYLLYVRVPGGSPPLVSIPSATLVALTPDALLVPTALPGGAQCTPHAAAIVDDMSEPNFNWDQPASRTFFRSFADIYDFLYLFPTYGMADYAGLSGTVFNDATGIGKSLHDNRWRFGSTRLMSCILMRAGITMPLLHETMHHWGATMDALFHTTSWGYHWGYAGVNGQLGGFDPATLRDNGDGTWAIRYCAPYGFAADDRPYGALELYIAGLVDTLGELGDIPVLVNPEMQGSWSRIAADRVDYVSAADIVATYGPRVPAAASSQHRFNAAFCWVGPRPVNAAAMSFLDLAARIYSGKEVVPLTHSFTTATRGVGAMDTRIRTRPGVHRRLAPAY